MQISSRGDEPANLHFDPSNNMTILYWKRLKVQIVLGWCNSIVAMKICTPQKKMTKGSPNLHVHP